ncbi:hypothetical protein ACWPMX_07800 [Tsuneonella sp. HG094]
MAKSFVKTSGFRELEAALLDLSTQVARRHGRKALLDAGEPIHEAYVAKTKVKSGTLRDNANIGTRLNRNQRRQSPRPGPSEIELHIGTADPAGIQEEFGIRQAANPSLTPAWDSEGGTRALDRIGKSLGESIERSARRGRPRKS